MTFIKVQTIDSISLNNITSTDMFKDIMRVFKDSPKPVIFDDHNNGNDTLNYEGIMLFIKENGEAFLVPEMRSVAFCLNPLYVGDNGEIRLSTSSCGGVVRNNLIPETFGIKLARIQETYSPEFLAEFQD